MKMKVLVAAATTLVSSSAFAGATGNVGGISEYMFRGVSQGTGAAVQGGLDYAHDSGFYVGTWASNVDWGVGNAEIDFYGGFTGSLAESVGFDLGAIYYYYPENDELGDPDYDPNTIEVYAGLILGPASLKYYYTPAYFGAEDSDGDDVGASYILGSLALPVSDTLNFTASLGYSIADEEIFVDGDETSDDYLDYSVGLAKTIDGGYTASFQIVGTTLEDDDIKPVIGVKKVFDL